MAPAGRHGASDKWCLERRRLGQHDRAGSRLVLASLSVARTWLGRQDSNLGSRDQNPLPYRLATPQESGSKVPARRTSRPEVPARSPGPKSRPKLEVGSRESTAR